VTQETELLQAIAALELKLVGAINSAVASLTNLINQNRLDQEQRNASFASADRMNELSLRVHRQDSTVSAAGVRIDRLETQLQRLQSTVDELRDQLAESARFTWSSLAGYAITLAIFGGIALMTYVLSH
jgi:predicted RNase H-like nuclease (RuvC/YqgF family)